MSETTTPATNAFQMNFVSFVVNEFGVEKKNGAIQNGNMVFTSLKTAESK